MYIAETPYGILTESVTENCYVIYEVLFNKAIIERHRYVLTERGKASAINQLIYLTNKPRSITEFQRTFA